MEIEIKGVVTPKIGFASHQNSVPILRELEIVSLSESHHEDLLLQLSANPPFLESKAWKIDALKGGTTLHITDRDVKLNAGLLADLTESLSGHLVLRVMKRDEVLAESQFPVELLARNEWGGCGYMPEMLPAFCMPNDAAIDQVLKGASDVLRRAGKNASINGYKDESRTRVWELASAVWSSVAGLDLRYALPPASFEKAGQKVRTPSAILEGRVATCLDTALLFAATLEQAGLNPLLVLTEGHAFTGVWLQPQEFSQLINEEAAAVRKRIELQELLVFETTLITNHPPVSFSKAVEHGKRQLTDEAFHMVLDIRRARMQRIRPLALPTGGPSSKEDAEVVISVKEALEEAPSLPGFDVEANPETQNQADKVAMWQRKLLDLTTRNRLLHLPESGKCVPLCCPDPALLEDRLAEGKRIRIVALPDLEAGGRDAALYAQQNREDLLEQYAREVLSRGEVLSRLPKAKLEAELVDLYRKSRSDLDEGGANTLFLAMGFLNWKKSPDDPRSYRAPLILLPVKLERKSALTGVTMVVHEDEPRFNLTLLELLRQDFELTIPGLDASLPTDESGIDLSRVWNLVRHHVRDIPGFEVSEDLVLGTFSFAKYLMWKDLSDRKEHLLNSPVVKHLIERTSDSFRSGDSFPRAEELDQKIDPSRLFVPLPADSSQLAAVVAAANGCDFVLDGPPGTGKSQTIANMIAHNLALGRRVLFVAEKMAALDVVYRRLKEKGLGDFCLELHSNKTSKVEVLKQLERAWDIRDSLSEEEWTQEAAEVQRLRDRLNAVVALLHQRRPNGLTLHHCIGCVVRDATEATPRFSWPEGTVHDVSALGQLRDVARRLDLNLGPALDMPGSFSLIERTDWSNQWQEAMVTAARAVPPRAQVLLEARDEFLTATSLTVQAGEEDEIGRLLAFAQQMLKVHGRNVSFAFAPDVTEKVSSARRALECIREYKETEKGLSVAYAKEGTRQIQHQQLERDWQEATGKFWFLATLAQKKVTQALAAQGGATGLPDLPKDLPKLSRMKELLDEMDALSSTLTGLPGWAGLNSDVTRLHECLELGEGLRQALSAMATSPAHLIELRGKVRALVVEANELLGPDGNIARATAKMAEACPAFRHASLAFRELCGTPEGEVASMADLQSAALDVQQNQARLKAWCDWKRVRAEAVSLNLTSLVSAIEAGAVPKGEVARIFETAYARWFASQIIDSEPQLRGFVPAEHMSDIEAYRQMDDRLSALSVRYIRAKLCGQIPSKNDVSRKDGFGVLKHELQKQRRHKPLRQLATEMGDAMTRLAPCMLMSPLSIAQYLPAELALFDLVIFDEASQIAPWDAIGSIARGKQVVIAGDPRQMPPTNFFNRAAAATDDDVEEDMESILDECLGAGVPRLSLSWHYRSRHESLIAFSNHRYYDSNLITFPAAVTRSSAVTWRRINGVYAKGKGRTNQAEAEAMVAEAVKRMTDPDFVAARKSLAIVTLNSEQQKLVEDLLDKARQRQPQIEPFFGEEVTEPVVVKNLETVQGDERDLIMLGIGYGPTEPGANTMSMSFGPLNRDGGWRRLNVAVTRARQEMMVFSSFDPSMVDLNRTSARAVRDLKHFLEFADRGPKALAEAIQGSVGGYDSPFEEAVAQGLRRLGWEVVPQIGVSRFRIDLGIVHPDRAGDYLVGVECDGATYHSAATARDRDKVRSAVLQGLGWSLLRVWSTEWWVDKEGALRRLHGLIETLLEESRERHREREANEPAAPAVEMTVEVRSETIALKALASSSEPEAESPLAETAVVSVAGTSGTYKSADLSSFVAVISADSFYLDAYDDVLAELIGHVISHESPIQEDVLIQKIARAHGFQKAGRLIRDRVLELVERHHHLRPDLLGGQFAWKNADAPDQWFQHRQPASPDEVRSLEAIPFEELRAAARAAKGSDLPLELARTFGLRRLTAQIRARLEKAVELMRQES